MSRLRLSAACDAIGLTPRGVQAMAARGEIPGATEIRVLTPPKGKDANDVIRERAAGARVVHRARDRASRLGGDIGIAEG